MDKLDLVNYWVETSDNDFRTMQHLFNSEDYHWAFMKIERVRTWLIEIINK